MATANPRSRRSATVSKYFSICSLRPVKTQTVPLRPAGGAQRAKRSSAPSGVLMVPETTSSGTGLEGIETSVMRQTRDRSERLVIKGFGVKDPGKSRPLERQRNALHIIFVQAATSALGNPGVRMHRTEARPDGGRDIATVAQWRTIHAF